MSRRAYARAAGKEKAVPVGIKYKSLDGEQNVTTITLGKGSSAPNDPVAKVTEPQNAPEPALVKAPTLEAGGSQVTDDLHLQSTRSTSRQNVLEVVACDLEDLQDGQMREIQIGEGSALLVNDKGEYHAIGAKCSHYGAPLVKGVFHNGHVRCPFHGACFNIKTGDIEDFPGLDSVPKYQVEIEDKKVKLRANAQVTRNHKRTKAMVCWAPAEDSSVTLIVGGGPSALACAETLRQENYKGKILMLTKDSHLPYDRPKLSKMMSVTEDQVLLRDQEFFTNYDIEIRTETEVISIDESTNSVNLLDGDTLNYSKLLLATGTVARQLLTTPGHDLENIRTLRTLDDATFISERAKDRRVVIIGTSFIGVETAAYLADKAQSVTIVDLVEAPFQLALGKEVGVGVHKLLEENGVKFYFKNSAKEFVGRAGKVSEVILQDDTRLEADLCIVGIGVVPATDFLKSSDVAISERGFVSVDKHMRTNQVNIFAAGDITHFPLFMADDQPVNIQHWQMAHQQGRIAALNMLDKVADITSVPFFWTQLFGKSIRYTGYGFGYDDIIIHGNPEQLKFIAYYTKGDRVIAAASMNEDPIAAHVAEAFLAQRRLTKDLVCNNPKEWIPKL